MSDGLDADDLLQVEGDDANKKKRRRRRRRKKKPSDGADVASTPQPRPEAQSLRGRRQVVEVVEPSAVPPASGRNPHRKRNSRLRREKPSSPAARRRRLGRTEMRSLSDWIDALPDTLLANLYKGLGGQPRRVLGRERMVQLSVRAVAQGNRLDALVRQLHERDRKALGALLQCGGIAQADEFHRTLQLAYGGHERDWQRALRVLGERGVVCASAAQDDAFFYVVPDPLIDGLVEALRAELELPGFEHDDMRVIEQKPFSPPLDFSITTLATYIAQRGLRLTQRQEVHKHDKEALDAFFGQLWEPDGELFHFHLDFLTMHGMVELRGEGLRLNRDVMEEWLQLEPEDQRDLVFRALERRFELAEWVLWAIHGVDGAWVAERPLSALYRHWKRGRDWEKRFRQGQVHATRASERESYSFSPLVQSGLLEMGQWGQEKFYRLTSRAQALMEPSEDDGFRQFYLTPDFKIAAPAGLAPILLFRAGEIAELKGCDRANSYLITETSVEAALEAGWKRDDVLQFLRDNSVYELPDNIEQTLKGWIGHRGDVEFHDLLLITVHRSQIRRLESNKRLKPYILHRFAPGMYAVDRSQRAEVESALEASGFAPARETRTYPGSPEAVEARQGLHRALGEARDAARDPMVRREGTVDPASLHPVPGSVLKNLGLDPADHDDGPPEVSLSEVQAIIDRALAGGKVLDMVYLARNGQRLECRVEPQRLAFKDATPVLVGLDLADRERRSYVLEKIERLRIEGAA